MTEFELHHLIGNLRESLSSNFLNFMVSSVLMVALSHYCGKKHPKKYTDYLMVLYGVICGALILEWVQTLMAIIHYDGLLRDGLFRPYPYQISLGFFNLICSFGQHLLIAVIVFILILKNDRLSEEN